MDARTTRKCLRKNTKQLIKPQRVAITSGEPAGIGPDIVVQLAQFNWPVELVVCADEKLLQDRAVSLGLPLMLLPYDCKHQPIPQSAGTLTIISVPLYSPTIAGKLNIVNSKYVIETLTRTCDGCINGEFSALITGPVHKGIINEAGIPFTGHTEFFKLRSRSQKVVMMFVTEKMRVALVTTHLPIKEVSNAITPCQLRETIAVLYYDLQTKLDIKRPHILVCGLNPHAGEGGYIGTEEIDIIIPVLDEMRSRGINLSGPLPADTIFQSKYLNNSDTVILAMYHDQGLPVLKYKGFGSGVNVTLGLPFIRTSVDHGTALDLAGHGKADAGSFIAALNLAIKIIINTL